MIRKVVIVDCYVVMMVEARRATLGESDGGDAWRDRKPWRDGAFKRSGATSSRTWNGNGRQQPQPRRPSPYYSTFAQRHTFTLLVSQYHFSRNLLSLDGHTILLLSRKIILNYE